MLRYSLVLAGLLSLAGLSAGGCRSCSSCHDYDPPVANCHCNDGGTHCACGGNSQCACGGNNASGPYTQPLAAPQGNSNGSNVANPQYDQQQHTDQSAPANAYPQQ